VPESLKVGSDDDEPHTVDDLNVADWQAAAGRTTSPAKAVADLPPGPPAWRRRRRWLMATRAWALAKMAALAYTTWWAMGYLHAHLGARLCGYGVACLFSAVGARWRRRYFGPGQLLEPELYEAMGRWLYRVGAALVVVGAAVAALWPLR
jgi:hypothetical protein